MSEQTKRVSLVLVATPGHLGHTALAEALGRRTDTVLIVEDFDVPVSQLNKLAKAAPIQLQMPNPEPATPLPTGRQRRKYVSKISAVERSRRIKAGLRKRARQVSRRGRS